MSDCIDYGGIGIRAPHTRELWERFRGPIPEGLSVLHSCNNSRCRNIDHLYLGTQADNIGDMLDAGHHISGFKNYKGNIGKSKSNECKLSISRANTKLSDEEINFIRSHPEIHYTKLVDQFKVSVGTIYNVRRRRYLCE